MPSKSFPVGSILKKNVVQHKKNEHRKFEDVLTIEEPLEIRVRHHTSHGLFKIMSLAVTMRTPGEDEDLVRGFLFTEGIISDMDEITQIETLEENIVLASLSEKVRIDSDEVKRNFYTTSSCGVCGKASIESIHSDTIYLPWSSKFSIVKSALFSLPDRLRQHQEQFDQTGGLHACALIDASGNIVCLREDVGRHNAMDKLIGSVPQFPVFDKMVLVSGRASFELVQKASKAGVPLMAAIGAPSSLAVQLAEEQGMGLIGFLRNGSFNVYTGGDRISD